MNEGVLIKRVLGFFKGLSIWENVKLI